MSERVDCGLNDTYLTAMQRGLTDTTEGQSRKLWETPVVVELGGTRTPYLRLAKAALSLMSYSPSQRLVRVWRIDGYRGNVLTTAPGEKSTLTAG